MGVSRHAIITLAILTAACQDKAGAPADDGNAAASSQTPTPEAISAALSSANYGQAAEMARAASKAQPNDPQLFLLLARAEARLNNLGSAVEALDMAFQKGFHDPRGAANHPDFDKIRRAPEFQALLKKWSLGAASSAAARQNEGADRSVTRAGDVSISEGTGGTRIQAGDIVIEE